MDDSGGSKPTAGDDDAAFPPAEAIATVQETHAPSPTTDDDCDDLYGDVNLFLPLSPPSPSSKSPPKTPSPGRSTPSPRRGPPPEPQPGPEPEPQPPKRTPPTPPLPLPAQKPAPPRSPPTTPVFIGELQYWTTDAEVEEALAPHGVLHGLHFFTDRLNGKSRGYCRADFLRPDAAAAAAAALDGREFNGRSCVTSLSFPPALLRLIGEDRDPHAVHHDTPSGATRGRGGRGRGYGGNSTMVGRGNVGPPHGDQPAVSPIPRPVAPGLPPLPFGGMMGGGGAGAGYGGGFAPMGQYNAGMAIGMMPPAMAPHVNPTFMAAGGMASMGGQGVWYNQQMGGNMWGGGQQQPWNFGCHGMPPRQQQQPKPPAPQQFNRNEDHGKARGAARRERGPGGRNDQEGDIGNERGYPDKRQYGRDGFDQFRKHDREERDRYRPRVLEERDQWDERDRFGGDRRRYQEYPDRDFERRGRTRSRSPSRDGDEDDHPRRRC